MTGTRLLGFEWRSDYGWKALPRPSTDANRVVEESTLMGWDTWTPRRVAYEIDQAIRRYS